MTLPLVCPKCRRADYLVSEEICPASYPIIPELLSGKVELNYDGEPEYDESDYSGSIWCNRCRERFSEGELYEAESGLDVDEIQTNVRRAVAPVTDAEIEEVRVSILAGATPPPPRRVRTMRLSADGPAGLTAWTIEVGQTEGHNTTVLRLTEMDGTLVDTFTITLDPVVAEEVA